MVFALLLAAGLATGCSPTQPFYFFEDGDLSHYVGMATNIEYPDVKTCSLQEVNDPPAPLTVSNPKFDEPWDLTLADAVKISLENGKVMRSLGVRVSSLQNIARTNIPPVPEGLTSQPAAAITVYDPALVESDPVFGVEGAFGVRYPVDIEHGVGQTRSAAEYESGIFEHRQPGVQARFGNIPDRPHQNHGHRGRGHGVFEYHVQFQQHADAANSQRLESESRVGHPATVVAGGRQRLQPDCRTV